MHGGLENSLCRASFHDAAKIHDRHPVAHQTHNTQVMRDEQIRQIKTLFQFLQEPQNGRLYGDIQAGRWLVKNDETWFEYQDTRQGQATLLPTAEFVRVALQVMRGESHRSDHL